MTGYTTNLHEDGKAMTTWNDLCLRAHAIRRMDPLWHALCVQCEWPAAKTILLVGDPRYHGLCLSCRQQVRHRGGDHVTIRARTRVYAHCV